MARRRKTRGIVPVLMLAIGLVAGWWVARHGLSGLDQFIKTEPTVASGDIRDVDFMSFTYAPHCISEDGNPIRVTVRDGKYQHEQEFEQLYFTVRSVNYGDLTGDGQADAVVATNCNTGGTGQFSEGMVFSMQAGQPTLIGRVEGGDRAYGGLAALTIEAGKLIVERYGTDDGPACCPEYIEVSALRWNGRQFVQEGGVVRKAAPSP